ncbi:hypothetical protein NEMBOFW57_005577 [Staphylotrichum longicolle]|uniref:WSC domain-containing protein n=1 Tax=Staphylotrichum longicolle TaxID=669026 RepID=A0AAD4EXA2_9PEZI|nr:hypothetical protein NEMBOFW57_005577 [Staphylotrichum longicolle]
MAPTRSSLGQLLPLISLLAATVTALPNPHSKRVPDNALSLGCYLDNAGGKRALEARSYASDDMTVDSCGAFCRAAKFPLFAVTYGRECFCGDAVSEGNTKVGDGDCSFPCAGDSTQTCGAGNRINLYCLPDGPVRKPASLSGITSLGCFVDSPNHIFPFKVTDADDMTAAKCAANCAGYPYFGTQWSRECYCGTTAPTVPAPAAECSMACSGNDDELCGAGMRINVYHLDSELAPNPTPAVDGFEYQGCYTDNVPQRVLAGTFYVETPMTLAKCAALCKASQYGWFGVTYGTECYCGASLNGDSVKVAEAECDTPCSGDRSETCGSANRLNVYKDPALVAPTAGNLETVGGFSYRSCWTDNTGDRSLKAVDYRTDDMTVEKCAERCADYLYFGLEYSRECYCGNELGGQAAPAKECGMLCMGGKGAQWCGGPDRLNLYSKAVTSSSTSSAESSTTSEASSTSEMPVVTSSLSSAESTSSSSSATESTSSAELTSTSSLAEPTATSSAEPTTSEVLTSSETSSTTSSTSTVPSSTSFTTTSSSTSQGPSLTTITSCPPTPTIADVPELCYYPKLPGPCDKLTSSTNYLSLSTALRSCQSTLRSWGMTANPVATACFPTTTAIYPSNAAVVSSTMSSVWSCLQTAGVLCNANADCVTKTYTVGQVPTPVPTVGVDVLGDGGFESGTFGNWSVSGFNERMTADILAGRPHSGRNGLRMSFANTSGASGVLFRMIYDVEAGKPYEFRLWLYSENNQAFTSVSQGAFPVSAATNIEGAQLYQAASGVWVQRIVAFTATSSFLHLRVTAGGNVVEPTGGNQGKNTIWIDDIQSVRMA